MSTLLTLTQPLVSAGFLSFVNVNAIKDYWRSLPILTNRWAQNIPGEAPRYTWGPDGVRAPGRALPPGCGAANTPKELRLQLLERVVWWVDADRIDVSRCGITCCVDVMGSDGFP